MKKQSQNIRQARPPLSIRFCNACNAPALFKYERNIHHSSCLKCGNRYCRIPTINEINSLLKKEYNIVIMFSEDKIINIETGG